MSLILRHMTVHADTVPIITDLNVTIPPGTITTLMGPSGSGKSSLLAFIAGCDATGAPVTGQVWSEQTRLDTMAPEQRQVGMLYQDPYLFPHLSVLENIMFAIPKNAQRHLWTGWFSGRRLWDRRTFQNRETIARAYLDKTGLANFGGRDPTTLSGGQKARVSIARMFAANPQIVLLDEPFRSLDVTLRDQIRTMTFQLIHARSIPALLVTHDQDDARAANGPIIKIDSAFRTRPHTHAESIVHEAPITVRSDS